MAYFGAGGETEKELRQILLLDGAESSKADVEYAYKLKNERSNRFQDQSIEFILVENAIPVSEKNCFDLRIADLIQTTFNSRAFQLM